MKYFVILTLALIGFSFAGKTQCTPLGDETTYGNGSWIGYVYSARENFTTGFYIGYTTESEIFNRDFGNDSVVTNGCKTDPTTFSVRYKMQKTFACGFYNITIGGDDGVRLSIDGGSTYLINGYFPQSYTTFSETVFLNGTYDFVLEYFEAYGDNRVSFSYSSGLGSSFGGTIGSDQEFCGSSGTIDPSILSNITDAGFCSGGSINYQWQISSDNSAFTNISGATSNSYDPPSGFPLDTTLYYRRKGGNGTDSAYSNTVFISNNTVPGDPNIYGNEEWIGYVFDGTNNFNINDYKGIMVETERFDQSFGGSNTNIPINGCPIVSESFTVRYKMQKTFTHGEYEFTIGGDDGVRLSLDGGATYLINDYTNHGYRTRSAIDTLNGTYNMVLDYFENGGGNRVTFNFTELTPLPVELIKFDGKVNNNQVDLFWITASEINNDYFTLEKSNDNKNFEILTQKVGAGTTNLIQIYEATDDSPCSDICYYRLKQTDFDGKTTTFDPIAISVNQNEDNFQDVKLYPNPLIDNKVNILLPIPQENEIGFFINDLIGKQYVSDITLINLENQTLVILEFSERPPIGTYLISVIINNEIITKKLLVE